MTNKLVFSMMVDIFIIIREIDSMFFKKIEPSKSETSSKSALEEESKSVTEMMKQFENIIQSEDKADIPHGIVVLAKAFSDHKEELFAEVMKQFDDIIMSQHPGCIAGYTHDLVIVFPNHQKELFAKVMKRSDKIIMSLHTRSIPVHFMTLAEAFSNHHEELFAEMMKWFDEFITCGNTFYSNLDNILTLVKCFPNHHEELFAEVIKRLDIIVDFKAVRQHELSVGFIRLVETFPNHQEELFAEVIKRFDDVLQANDPYWGYQTARDYCTWVQDRICRINNIFPEQVENAPPLIKKIFASISGTTDKMKEAIENWNKFEEASDLKMVYLTLFQGYFQENKHFGILPKEMVEKINLFVNDCDLLSDNELISISDEVYDAVEKKYPVSSI